MHFNFCAKIEQLFKKMPNFALFLQWDTAYAFKS